MKILLSFLLVLSSTFAYSNRVSENDEIELIITESSYGSFEDGFLQGQPDIGISIIKGEQVHYNHIIGFYLPIDFILNKEKTSTMKVKVKEIIDQFFIDDLRYDSDKIEELQIGFKFVEVDLETDCGLTFCFGLGGNDHTVLGNYEYAPTLGELESKNGTLINLGMVQDPVTKAYLKVSIRYIKH